MVAEIGCEQQKSLQTVSSQRIWDQCGRAVIAFTADIKSHDAVHSLMEVLRGIGILK